MYILITFIVCILHLPITALELTPISPREVSRPETPSEPRQIVKLHQRVSRAASLSVATTISRSSISGSEPVSPNSANAPSPTQAALLQVKTDSPKHVIPIRVSPQSKHNLFPSGYGVKPNDTIPSIEVDDDNGISWKTCLCSCIGVPVILGGTIATIVLLAMKYG